jgi:hypothetical protein
MRRNRRRHDAAEREHAKLWGIGTESANACLSQRLLLLKAQPIHYCKPLPVSRGLTCSRQLERIEWRLWHGDAGEALFRTRELADDGAALKSGYLMPAGGPMARLGPLTAKRPA